ncbi:MAG TPA: PAS domain-containing sensor histidine kinase [Micropepsaceae bacterium]|nr:PAS domain-containing sensor histidine kinase [Micropepsaceae bacterium]
MQLVEANITTASRENVKATLAAPVLDGFAHIVGRWTFILSIVLGFVGGFLLLPVAGPELIGAMVSMGAIAIAAVAARHALARKSQIEVLQQRLQDEASYHAFVDAAIEGFFRTTRDGYYLIVNPALTRIYGYDSPEQLKSELTDIGQSLYVDPNRRGEFQRLMAANGRVKDFVSQIRQRDGTLIWISENARSVTDEDGQFLFYEGTVEDITLQRESEEATRRALIETQEAARAKAAFLAAMSHELKTPLNAVIGFSDLMRQELFGPVNEPRYRGYIADIHDNGRRLLGMINDILDLSRVESHLLDLEDDAVSVQHAVASACSAVLEDKSDAAAINIDVPAHLPLLRVDPRRFHQILTHLLSNAVKFTPAEGRITVRVNVTRNGAIAITIGDTGIGMDPGRIGHALEPFKQLDGRLSRRFEGVGLGLPLANALVRLHDGTLDIESTLGAGTIVTICFPPERNMEMQRAACA